LSLRIRDRTWQRNQSVATPIAPGPHADPHHIPVLPFSREVSRLEWLKRSLTVYRLAFGQPRQEDLLEYLHSLLGTDIAAEDLADLQIRLEP
jgi:hypothetical protein